MPNLDGVSACHLINQIGQFTIIAMTSNIRSDDINLYYQHGMSDILPKPFTKEGLLQLLEKHLNHLKKTPNPPTLDDIKHEDHHTHHTNLLNSPQKPHTPASTWTSTNSPQTSNTSHQHQPGLSPAAHTDASDHSTYHMYAGAPVALNPNGLTYIAPPAPQPQLAGQRRPLDLSDAEMANAKRQQQMYGMHSR